MTKQSKRIIEASDLSHITLFYCQLKLHDACCHIDIFTREFYCYRSYMIMKFKMYFDGNAIGYFTLKSVRNQPEKTLNTQTKCYKKPDTKRSDPYRNTKTV